MEKTMTIQFTNIKTEKLLRHLEELHLIKILKDNKKPTKHLLSDKYKGFLTKEEGENFNSHIKQMREEWENI